MKRESGGPTKTVSTYDVAEPQDGEKDHSSMSSDWQMCEDDPYWQKRAVLTQGQEMARARTRASDYITGYVG